MNTLEKLKDLARKSDTNKIEVELSSEEFRQLESEIYDLVKTADKGAEMTGNPEDYICVEYFTRKPHYSEKVCFLKSAL